MRASHLSAPAASAPERVLVKRENKANKNEVREGKKNSRSIREWEGGTMETHSHPHVDRGAPVHANTHASLRALSEGGGRVAVLPRRREGGVGRGRRPRSCTCKGGAADTARSLPLWDEEGTKQKTAKRKRRKQNSDGCRVHLQRTGTPLSACLCQRVCLSELASVPAAQMRCCFGTPPTSCVRDRASAHAMPRCGVAVREFTAMLALSGRAGTTQRKPACRHAVTAQ